MESGMDGRIGEVACTRQWSGTGGRNGVAR